MKLLTKTGAIFDHIVTGTFMLACVLLALMALSVTYEVLMRYVFSRPTIGILEINQYALIWITFLSAAWVQRRGGHAAMDTLLLRLSSRSQLMMTAIISTVGGIVWLIIVWYSTQVIWRLFQEGAYIFSPLEPLKAPIVIIIPIGSFLLFIELMRRTYLSLRSRNLLQEKTHSEEFVEDL